MKPETQLKIGRITAIVLIGVFLAGPPCFVFQKIQEGEGVTPKELVLFCLLMYPFLLPFVAMLVGYIWALKYNKFKIATILFSIYAIWGLFTIIYNGRIGYGFIEIITLLLLLQGLFGIRKLQKSQNSPTFNPPTQPLSDCA